MKKINLLIGAVVSGLVAGSAVNLTTAHADNHDKKAEGKEHACKGGSCKGGSCKGAKHKKLKPAKAATPPAAEGTAAPAEGAAAPTEESK